MTVASPFVELRQSLPSRIDAISPFVAGLMRFIKLVTGNFRNEDVRGTDLEIALQEALTNAVIHGNQEDPRKQVHITCRSSKSGQVSVTVRDEGDGFDAEVLPDPTDAPNRLLNHGRGVYLMRALMDEVSFAEKGRVVHMRKRLQNPVQGAGLERLEAIPVNAEHTSAP